MAHDALTIVMYHYVRDLRHSRFPEIKGLATEDFAQQIRFLKKNFNVVSGPELMNAVVTGEPLPPRPVLLSFDDGYIDHYTDVFPILDEEGLPGCFFPPAKALVHHQVLDVNKIHFILASTAEKQRLVDYVVEQVEAHRSRYDLLTPSEYFEKIGIDNRFDPAEVIFCKRMLQRELPAELRLAMVDELFHRFVTSDEGAFSRELYMSEEQLKVLQRHGMYVGSHSYDHLWMNTLTPEQQEYEVDQSIRFLESIGADTTRWMMCYPYGGVNDSLVSILKRRNCVVGLSTVLGRARLGTDNPLTLPRLDTIDFPKDANADADAWLGALKY